MEAVMKMLQGINQSNAIFVKIAAILIILTLIQVLRRFFVGVVIKTIENLTKKTKTTLDDELISILKSALNWLILIGGFWVIKEILAQELGPKLTETIGKSLNLIVIFIIGYIVYRSSSILGQIIANFVLQTETELDELLRPLMPKIFQSAAVVVLAIKISEIFLGQSAGALVGLLGGAGITFGLLLKDIVYDWFCTVIIYSDALFKEGDWVGVSGLDGFVQVLHIGFRTTTLHVVKWGSIIKMPNSRLIGGVVENWSQNPGEELRWGLNLVLKIDGISARQTARICDSIQQMPKSIAGLSPVSTVRFKNIEKNARVIEIMAFVNDDNLYFQAERELNLAILEMLEQEGIDFLYVDLRTEPEKYKLSIENN
ncbi:mechanosensitive ion channel protein MscS [Cylindrospermopsis raciborskii C04]|uniref:Mechanosensitive ion channel protein MscS n=1 Tax=Cylindrospermopsis raciborskii C07 TaxID=2014886 RepID=A0ABX4WGP7_9CYAN|nr:mechanosensitive ion channel domain-containing protein [Cylindrospermopsis raciborskii]PNJ91353.1 mechanosensitive ion channel protein MscS [Cylindrospermopsis raciborskii C07]PNJ91791.1 mechanosensitive ion channel protein MscS [Cylindrospermopsis raciborskii C04]PNJ95368.1 mechanosensitive ion channel protein MscS [Cylindrospermopsis raciborskii C03]